jgi:hypothetical protein
MIERDGGTPNPNADAFEAALRRLAGEMDALDYFQLLNVKRATSLDDWPDEGAIRDGFAKFATRFHPDRFKLLADDARRDAEAIFRRGNEAFRALRNPRLRASYLHALSGGALRLSADEIARASSHTMEAVRAAIMVEADVDKDGFQALVTTQAAVPFAREADAMILRGDVSHGILQAQIAAAKEPRNDALHAKLAALLRTRPNR